MTPVRFFGEALMRHRVLQLMLATAVALPPALATAQGTVTLQASANAATTMYKNDTLVVPIIADLSAAAGRAMASVQFDVTYSWVQFEIGTFTAGSFGATTKNSLFTGTGSDSTRIERIAVFDAVGTTTTVTLGTLRLVRKSTISVTPTTTIGVTVTSLADELGGNITSAVRNLTVTQVNTNRPVAFAVTTQPGGAVGGQVFSTQPVVEFRDGAGVLSTVGDAVTASVASGSGTLSGTTTVNAVGGVATFTNLKITGTGAHTLNFASTGLTGATSASFTVQPPATILVAFGTDTLSTTLTGTKLALPLRADMSQAQGKNLASITGSLAYDTARFHFDSVKAGLGSITPNATVAGSVGFSIFDAVGTTTTQTLATFHFTAHAVGPTPMVPVVTVMGDDMGADLLPFLVTRAHNACVVAAAGRWGDATGDGLVNVVDAQQIARFTVSLPVANLVKLQQNGDVNADGVVNIVDAQQIARFTVGLSSSTRTNTVIPGTCAP